MLLVISGRHTQTQKKERKNGPSPVSFCLICVVCCLSSGDPRRVQLPVGVGVEGRRGYTARSPLFFSWITEIESTSLCVWRARNDGGSPSEDSPAQSLLLFTINLHTFTFSLAAPGRKEGRPLARGQEEGGQNNLNPSHTSNLYPSSQVRNQSRNWRSTTSISWKEISRGMWNTRK